MMPKRIPFLLLVKQSGFLFLSFLVGAVLVSSIQEQEVRICSLFTKLLTIGSLFIIIFFINAYLFYYFDCCKKNGNEKIGKRTFFYGYVLSFVVAFMQHHVIFLLHAKGITIFDDMPTIKLQMDGWKLCSFIFYTTFLLYSFVFLVQNFVMNNYEKNRIKMMLMKMQTANMEVTNQLLQQQIRPHFLFNALNILKSLIRKDPQKAETYLLRLSDFLRVSIDKNTSGVDTIKEELKICNDYMEMQKIRFGNALHYAVNLDETGEIMNRNLPFFSLQPLLENAIKHNALTEDNPLYITIDLHEDYLVISNNLQPKKHFEVSTGNGHSMLQQRYTMLSGDEVIIKQENGQYTVSLKILN